VRPSLRRIPPESMIGHAATIQAAEARLEVSRAPHRAMREPLDYTKPGPSIGAPPSRTFDA